MSRLVRKRLILAREGSGDFVAADAILATESNIVPVAGDQVPLDRERPYFGSQKQVLVNAHQTTTFSVEFAAGENAGEAQPWGRLLKACGMAEVLDPSATPPTTTYMPVTGQAGAVKLGYVQDGTLHTINNSRGSFVLEFPSAGVPRFQFDFTGDYAGPGDAPSLTGDFSAFQEPQIPGQLNTPTVSIFGQTALPLARFAFTLGNTVEYRSLINANPESLRTDRQSTAELVIDATARATWDPFTVAKAGTVGAVQIVHGLAGGRQITIDMPNCALNPNVSYGDDRGILQNTLPLQVLPTDAGNDEITITIT